MSTQCNSSREFDGKKLKSTTKEGLDISEEYDKKKLEELKVEFEPLTKLLTKLMMDVNVSDRIADSPCVLTASEYGWSANMERVMKAQAPRDSSMTSYMVFKKTMEVNPTHSIKTELKKKGLSRQIRQDSGGFDLASLRYVSSEIRLQSG